MFKEKEGLIKYLIKNCTVDWAMFYAVVVGGAAAAWSSAARPSHQPLLIRAVKVSVKFCGISTCPQRSWVILRIFTNQIACHLVCKSTLRHFQETLCLNFGMAKFSWNLLLLASAACSAKTEILLRPSNENLWTFKYKYFCANPVPLYFHPHPIQPNTKPF